MITVRQLLSLTVVMTLLGAFSCSDEFIDGEIPPATFPDIFIDLNLPQYSDLSIVGGHILLSEGVRGIILFRVDESTYNAFERNCSYLPYEASSTIEVHQSGRYLSDPSCGSSFSLQDGTPTGGPARLPLRRYQVNQNGRTLTITDEPLF